MRRVAFVTLGCKVNQYDTQAMEKAFADKGYRIVEDAGEADAVIVNTCTVTFEADRKSRQMIRRAVRDNPGALVVAAGCFVQGDPKAAAAIEGVGAVAGSLDRMKLVDAVDEALSQGDAEEKDIKLVRGMETREEYEDMEAEGADGMSRAYLKIEDGCDAFCSYCFVPYVRGRVRSRSLSSIRREAQRLAAAGFREIVLTGIHLGCYGKDSAGGQSLADAVKAAAEPEEILRVRLSSLEPTELTDEILALFRYEPKLAPHLHLPLQSGDDNILKAMNRHYDSACFLKAVERAKDACPSIGLTTDVIAGFPGETEEMFANTLLVVEKSGFLRVHAFPFSRRKGTPADRMQGQVPTVEKATRVKRLGELARTLAERRHARMLGKDFEVILEKETSQDDGFSYEGYSGDYVRIRFHSGSKLQGSAVVRVSSYDAEVAYAELLS